MKSLIESHPHACRGSLQIRMPHVAKTRVVLGGVPEPGKARQHSRAAQAPEAQVLPSSPWCPAPCPGLVPLHTA